MTDRSGFVDVIIDLKKILLVRQSCNKATVSYRFDHYSISDNGNEATNYCEKCLRLIVRHPRGDWMEFRGAVKACAAWSTFTSQFAIPAQHVCLYIVQMAAYSTRRCVVVDLGPEQNRVRQGVSFLYQNVVIHTFLGGDQAEGRRNSCHRGRCP